MAGKTSIELIRSLAGLPSETPWVEFKVNNSDATMVAKDISALANSAAYLGRECGYLIWGVDDLTHDLVGTAFDPFSATAHGNELLTPWLRGHLSDNAQYDFEAIEDESGRYVACTVHAALGAPVTYGDGVFIREGSSTMRVRRGSQLEGDLWRRLRRESFESAAALEGVRPAELRALLHVDRFFDLMGLEIPESPATTIDTLEEQELVLRDDGGTLTITNLGALLLAKDLRRFPGLVKRCIRVVCYNGSGSLEIRENREFRAGYAVSLGEAESLIVSTVPAHEVREGARRLIVRDFPARAIRELLVNCVMHQDLTNPYQGPFVGVHAGWVEFSNPGESLIVPMRVLNAPPVARNPKLANLLRLMGLCEEGGTGWDLTIEACEAQRLPAPLMRSDGSLGTLVTLTGEREYSELSRSERLDAAYWHACLAYARRGYLTNRSLRERFGLPPDKTSVQAISRLIREACDRRLLKRLNDDAPRSAARYIPGWA